MSSEQIKDVMRRQYQIDHSVDVKSTQIGGAIKSLFKFAGIAGGGVLLLIGLVITYAIIDNIRKEQDQYNKFISAPLVDYKFSQKLFDDYRKNPYRYEENKDQWVSIKAQVISIETNHIDLGLGNRPIILCKINPHLAKIKSKVSLVSPWEWVTIAGQAIVVGDRLALRNCGVR